MYDLIYSREAMVTWVGLHKVEYGLGKIEFTKCDQSVSSARMSMWILSEPWMSPGHTGARDLRALAAGRSEDQLVPRCARPQPQAARRHSVVGSHSNGHVERAVDHVDQSHR